MCKLVPWEGSVLASLIFLGAVFWLHTLNWEWNSFPRETQTLVSQCSPMTRGNYMSKYSWMVESGPTKTGNINNKIALEKLIQCSKWNFICENDDVVEDSSVLYYGSHNKLPEITETPLKYRNPLQLCWNRVLQDISPLFHEFMVKDVGCTCIYSYNNNVYEYHMFLELPDRNMVDHSIKLEHFYLATK